MDHLDHLDHLGSGEEGNTNSSPDLKKKRPPSGRYWCFTWNNYPSDAVDQLDRVFCGLGAEWLLGHEVGESGTPHLQGFADFGKRKRPQEAVKIKQIHWERCKGSRTQNIEYVTKDGNDIRGNIKYDKPLKLITPGGEGYEWQTECLNIIKQEPDDRTIHWYYEETGNRGKSALVKYLCAKHDGLLVSGKGSDVKYMVKQFKEAQGYYPTLILYDIPRSCQDYVSYTAVEEVKNGCFASTKYECNMVLMNNPHVVCFANFEPEYMKMSADRWTVHNIC